MLEVKNVKVYGLEESVIACRNAMRLTPPEYTDDEFEKSLQRAVKLVQASKNGDVKCHDNFLVGIRVSFDVTYPQYWTPEAQRYHWFDIVTSASKMHRLTQMDIDKCCNKYVTQNTINELNRHIDDYNWAKETTDDYWNDHSVKVDFRDGSYIMVTNKKDLLYYCFMRCLSNCPLGLELFERVSINYKQLQTIYLQRRHHKLQEDWGAFCEMIESLPFAHQLIIGDKPTISDEEFNLEMKKL